MAKMNVRKMKMRCDVKGCKNVDSYCISRSAELGGVVICEDCLRDALTAIENYVEPKKKTDTKPPELFYSGIEDTVSETGTPQNETPNTETEELTPHPPQAVPLPLKGKADNANLKGEGVKTNSSKERQKTAATPKRAAKKKTAERGNDK